MGFLGRAVGGHRAPGGKFAGAPRAPRAWREGAPSLRRVPFVYKPAGRRAGRPPLPARPAPLPAPRPPLPAPGPRPSGAASSSRAHLLHAPPPASALPAGRELPSSPYFPRCNLSFLFMDVGLLFFFFFFLLMDGRGLGIPEGALFTDNRADPVPLSSRTPLFFLCLTLRVPGPRRPGRQQHLWAAFLCP